jgi:hypothetical protein
MNFEFDPAKNEKNKAKHGIDFLEAQALWDDPRLLEIPAKTVLTEPRCLVVGKIHQWHWSAVVVHRDDNVRLISVRRSTQAEVKVYENDRF